MRITELKPAEGSKKDRKRVGRGIGSGHGKTATRGHKGQKARSGGSIKPGFEGGQMPLQRRLPKRGFSANATPVFKVINLKDIESWGLVEVSPEILMDGGHVSSFGRGLKVLSEGKLSRAVRVRAHAFSEAAVRKITEAGGQAEVI